MSSVTLTLLDMSPGNDFYANIGQTGNTGSRDKRKSWLVMLLLPWLWTRFKQNLEVRVFFLHVCVTFRNPLLMCLVRALWFPRVNVVDVQ